MLTSISFLSDVLNGLWPRIYYWSSSYWIETKSKMEDSTTLHPSLVPLPYWIVALTAIPRRGMPRDTTLATQRGFSKLEKGMITFEKGQKIAKKNYLLKC